ncbi:mannitol 1-phosphate dehydrogenase [Drepanopeziza brunnea f. sp. 'multigermtubi' MB_m1]|uniref:Mannitol 1-phosphate dehydrogenase n=1 Tax=Marssonina brunnea f. sp. multigermtubi (strain MB_m1) TaxID=1072389 RepID=K1X207_MARBU|nr:mannitol 1-phosphate dehydrogenase [Drepanopeziza brunnea f. sp. 'multigermtubi' MB_m1]EKD19231.1 mannitol 1-phosphate dehydrogenase [Drepanopeziza brunnea f. sp. 'multigermtubi' MB_m1]
MAAAATKDPKRDFHVAVCGGGIGGLCMAIGLLHQQVSCTLYEAAPAFAEIGAGVSFGPNAVRAMSLIDPAIKAGYDKIATSNTAPEKKQCWFDFSLGHKDAACGEAGTPVAEVVAGEVGQSSVHRAHFLDQLVQLVPAGVAQFGKRLKDVEQVGEKMKLTFHDGTTAEADAVIGCDGIKSRARHILLGRDHEAASARFTGKYAYRGLIPMEKAVDALGRDLAGNSQMYMGRHGHVLTFPIEGGKTMNVVAFQSKADGKWENEKWVLPMKKEDMFRDFEGWGESVQRILSLMEKPDVWALFDHPPAPTYFKGRLAILGDAAHASTPHQGAGAGQAIEDAFVMSNLLGQVKSVDEIEKAFYAYDAVRRPRSQKVVTTSREAAALYEFEDESMGTDLEKIRKRLLERYDWIWNEDLPQQLKKAQDLMGLKANL